MGKIGEAYVEVGAKTKGFDKGLDDSQKKLTAWAGAAAKMVAAFVIAKAGQTLVGFLAGAAKAASDLAESANKAGVAFGSAFPKIQAFAEDMATRFGLVKSEIFDITAGLGFMITNAGFAKDKAAEMAIALAKSAADVSSIQNMPVGVVLEKMRAGISGEAEPLRTLGVNVTEENVSKQAKEMGMNKVLTDQEKIYVRIALILKGLSYAQGDLEKTIGGYANATRRLAGEWENLKAVAGGPLASIGADAMAAGRQQAESKGLWSFLLTPPMNPLQKNTGYEAFQKEADKRAGVNSKEMTKPGKTLLEHQLEETERVRERPRREAHERLLQAPARRGLADLEQGWDKLKDAGARVMQGPLGGIVSGYLTGGLVGAAKGAAQSGVLNPIATKLAAQQMGHTAGGTMDIGEYAKYAQEQENNRNDEKLEAAKQAAENTKLLVGQGKDLLSAMKDLARAFGGTKAIMRGPS